MLCDYRPTPHWKLDMWELANIRIQTKLQFQFLPAPKTYLIQLIEWFIISSSFGVGRGWGVLTVLEDCGLDSSSSDIECVSFRNLCKFWNLTSLVEKKHWDVDLIESNSKPRKKKYHSTPRGPPPSSHIFSLNLQMRGYAVLLFRQPSPPCDLFTYEAVKPSWYLPKEKLWRRHLQMWACCLSWEFQEFQLINLCDLHPCQECGKEPKFSLGLISKLNPIHTSTGAFY